MRPQVPPHLSRPLAIGILVLLLALVGVFGLMPLINSYAESGAALAHNKELIERYQQQNARRPLLEAELQALAELQARSGFYLAGETDAVAAATLQDKFRELAARSGDVGAARPAQGHPHPGPGQGRREPIDHVG